MSSADSVEHSANRRISDSVAVQLMAEVRTVMQRHEDYEMEKFAKLEGEIRTNREESETRHEVVIGRLESLSNSTLNVINKQNDSLREIHKLFMDAFPEGNAEAHRRAHEAWLAKSEEDRKFWLGVKEKALTAIIVAVIGWAGLALWAAFLSGPK